jgi:hypothetical protein
MTPYASLRTYIGEHESGIVPEVLCQIVYEVTAPSVVVSVNTSLIEAVQSALGADAESLYTPGYS